MAASAGGVCVESHKDGANCLINKPAWRDFESCDNRSDLDKHTNTGHIKKGLTCCRRGHVEEEEEEDGTTMKKTKKEREDRGR